MVVQMALFIVIIGHRKPHGTSQMVPDILLPASHCRAAAQILVVIRASYLHPNIITPCLLVLWHEKPIMHRWHSWLLVEALGLGASNPAVPKVIVQEHEFHKDH